MVETTKKHQPKGTSECQVGILILH